MTVNKMEQDESIRNFFPSFRVYNLKPENKIVIKNGTKKENGFPSPFTVVSILFHRIFQLKTPLLKLSTLNQMKTGFPTT